MKIVCTQKYGPHHTFCPPRGYGTGRTEFLTVTAQYLGSSLRAIPTHTIPTILKILVFLAVSHLLRYITVHWTMALSEVLSHSIHMTLTEPTVLPSFYRQILYYFLTLELVATVGI